jgi:hypothetical protein
MASVKDHYDTHLAPLYTWTRGGAAGPPRQFADFLRDRGLLPSRPEATALDLGVQTDADRGLCLTARLVPGDHPEHQLAAQPGRRKIRRLDLGVDDRDLVADGFFGTRLAFYFFKLNITITIIDYRLAELNTLL